MARKNTTSREARERWKDAHYSRLTIYLPKADAAAYKRKCEEKGQNLSDIPKASIYDFLRDE